MMRYREVKRECPRCKLRWNDEIVSTTAVQNLKKVDFFWINRDQRSFEWFLQLLNQMEAEQALAETNNHDKKDDRKRFLDFHMYFTGALQRTDIKAVGLQLALDLLHQKV